MNKVSIPSTVTTPKSPTVSSIPKGTLFTYKISPGAFYMKTGNGGCVYLATGEYYENPSHSVEIIVIPSVLIETL